MAGLFEYHPDDEELHDPNSRTNSLPSEGANVGWLLGTNKVTSRGHNLGAGVVLGV